MSAVAKNRAGAVLDLQRAAGNAAVAGLLAPVQRKAKKASTGVAKYGTVRLTDRLQDMMQRGVLGVAGAPATLDRDQLFLLQGVANVETGGVDNAVYTKDNMYVSLGFKQVTLGYGELYEIIKAASSSFAKHGIVLGSGTYTLKGKSRPAIEGAPDPVALKTPPWTDRFFDAGGEDEVVSAMVAYTLKALGSMERRFAKDSPGKSSPWMKDPTARAWLLEAQNNRPIFAYAAAKATLARTSGQHLTRDAFLAVLESEIRGAYEAKGEGHKAGHIISKIPRVAPSGGGSGQQPAPPVTPKPTPEPAKGAGVDLVDKATAVLPPAAAAAAGAGPALLGTIAAAGLTGAALRLLAASGYTDANALTNIAFWSAHPDLFGTKLQPSQPGFTALAAEWMHLRDGVVADALRAPTSVAGAAPATASVPTAATPTPVTKPSSQAPAPPGDRAATDGTFVADGLRSTIDLLPEEKGEYFRRIPWGWADYPGTQFPITGMTPEEITRFQSDKSLMFAEKEQAFVGKHQSDALKLFEALAANRPGGGERRVNTGKDAVITKEKFAASKDKAGIDRYIVDQIDPTPLPGGGKLNKHAAQAFREMRKAALAHGIPLNVLSGFRSRASEEAMAKKITNRYAFGGFSPHSLGLAADVALRVGTSAKAGFSETSTRMDKLVDMLRSPAYKWIYMHGADYHFYQYQAEPWHWEYNPPGFKDRFWAER